MPNEISKKQTKLLIVESDLTSRIGLSSIISDFDFFNVIAFNSVTDIDYTHLNADIVLLVAKDNFNDFVKKLVTLKQELVEAKFLVIQKNLKIDQLGTLLGLGVDGIIYEPLEYDVLLSAIMTLKWGGAYFPAILRKDISKISLNQISVAMSTDQFKGREIQIIQMIANGQTNKKIADQVCLSERTIEWHRKKMIQKANVKSTLELVLFAIDNGLIKSPYKKNHVLVDLGLSGNTNHAIAV